MRSLLYSLIALVGLACGALPAAYAQTAYASSDSSGTVTCSSSGTCNSITFTPMTGTDSYLFESAYCFTTTPLSSPTVGTVAGSNGGPCASYTDFNSSYLGAFSQTWGGSFTINVTSGGEPVGTYTVYLYIDYSYCPTADLSGGACSVGNGGTGYEAVQSMTLSATVGAPTTSNDTWVTGSWGTCSSSGTQTRSVTCQDSSGNIVSNSNCTATEPATTQSCTPTTSVNSQDPTCTDPTCTAVNSGPGVTLPNCVPDPSQGKFCVVVPTKQ